MQSILDMPAIDPTGQVLTNPQTGQPLPGRARAIAMSDPTANTLVENLMKHEQFEGEQQDNVEIGRRGVKQLQPVDNQ
jgi:hypothetical protein